MNYDLYMINFDLYMNNFDLYMFKVIKIVEKDELSNNLLEFYNYLKEEWYLYVYRIQW